MTPLVRLATLDDADALSSLNADVQALHAAALPWRFKPPSPDTFPPSAAAALLAQPDNRIFVAQLDSSLVGYAYAEIVRRAETSFSHAFDMVYLHHLSVRAAHRRQGVGSALLAAVRSAATDRGIDLVALDVWTFNDDARAFFHRHGFTSYNERLWSRA